MPILHIFLVVVMRISGKKYTELSLSLWSESSSKSTSRKTAAAKLIAGISGLVFFGCSCQRLTRLLISLLYQASSTPFKSFLLLLSTKPVYIGLINIRLDIKSSCLDCFDHLKWVVAIIMGGRKYTERSLPLCSKSGSKSTIRKTAATKLIAGISSLVFHNNSISC